MRPPTSAPAFGPRLAIGLLGVLLAAIMAGMNNRVPALLLTDLQGDLGVAGDNATWLNTAYAAGELAAMPFASWLAITFSMRRFHMAMLAVAMTLSALMPLVQDLPLLIALRALQGTCAGMLIPILMMAALAFLPPSVRLHGLALYALTATFSPNVAPWLAALCADRIADLRWTYWHAIPVGMAAMAMVAWGVPRTPMALARLAQGNWFGLALGVPGLALLVVGLDQGVRLDWFHSPLISASTLAGSALTALFLWSEWRHPTPFIRLQLLGRRNLGLGFSVFFLLLIASATAVALPLTALTQLQGFRFEQSAPIGLVVGLPQLALGSCTAMLLNHQRVDARLVFATGLLCVAAGCWQGSGITSEWMVLQFIRAEIFYALGLPLTIVPLLFLATSVLQAPEGPHVSGIINTLRAFGSVVGGAVIGQFLAERGRFHGEMLLDQASLSAWGLSTSDTGVGVLAQALSQQASVLAIADVYRVFGVMSLLLIPIVLRLHFVPAPAPAPGAARRLPTPPLPPQAQATSF